MSKGYTLSYFIKTLSSATPTKVTRDGVYNTVSPRDGVFSVKADALDSWLDHQTLSIARGDNDFASYGKTSRARLLKALRNRKNNGTV